MRRLWPSAVRPALTQTQMQTLAQQYFNANYRLDSSFGTPGAVTVTTVGQQVRVSSTNADADDPPERHRRVVL